MSHYLALIDEADGEFGVSIPDCPGCTAMGHTIDEAIENAVAALREWMADRIADRLNPPQPRSWQAMQHDPALAADFAAGAAASYIPCFSIPVGSCARIPASMPACSMKSTATPRRAVSRARLFSRRRLGRRSPRDAEDREARHGG